GKKQLNETETGRDQNSDKKPRYTNTYRKLNKYNCENKENKPSSSTSFRFIVQPQKRLSVMNMNKKAESSNTYNTGKAKLAKRKIPELQEFDTNTHEALVEILKKLSKIEKDYESILLSGALALNCS
ncbi:6086_t:CDS:2, partial [Dentiscutata heterogama]